MEGRIRKRAVPAAAGFHLMIWGMFLLLMAILTGYILDFMRQEIRIANLPMKAVDYEMFRRMEIDERILIMSEQKISSCLKKYPELAGAKYMDQMGYLTLYMMANNFGEKGYREVSRELFIRGMAKVGSTPIFAELYDYYGMVLNDLKYFPVPVAEDEQRGITYIDSWFAPRSYGGDRRHEGTDIMDSSNTRGYYPVISMTDGIIENLGWLEQGGWRIGVRSPAGGYFYYAHLDSFAPDLKAGDVVIAGQLLGKMGDSGYGPEGTTGKFDVHLHMGIYVMTPQGEMSVNPYHILTMMNPYRIRIEFN